MSFKKAVFWQYLTTFIQGLLQIISIMIFSRLLSIEDFGLLAIISFFTNLTLIISQLGFGASIIQKNDLSNNQLNAAFTGSLIFGIICTIILIIFSGFISEYFEENRLKFLIQISSITFLIASFYSIHESILTKNLEFKYLSIINSIGFLFGNFITSIILLYLDFGVYSIVFGNLFYHIIKIIFYYNKLKLKFNFNLRELESIYKFGLGFSITRILNFFSTNIDNLLISKFMGVYTAGIYSRSYNIVQIPIQYLVSSVEKVLFPYLSSIKNDSHILKKRYLEVLEITNNIMIPISVAISLYSKEIIELLLGPKWSDSIIPLQILALTIFIRNSTKINDSLIKSYGLIKERILKEFIYFILIIISIIFSVKNGINYLCMLLLGINVINFIFSSTPIIKIINISYLNIIKSFKQGINLSILILCIWFIILKYTDINYNPLINVVIISVINIVVILFFILITWKSDLLVSRKIKQFINKKK